MNVERLALGDDRVRRVTVPKEGIHVAVLVLTVEGFKLRHFGLMPFECRRVTDKQVPALTRVTRQPPTLDCGSTSLGTMVENLLLEPRTASFGTEIGSPQDVGKPLARHRGSLLLPVLH